MNLYSLNQEAPSAAMCSDPLLAGKMLMLCLEHLPSKRNKNVKHYNVQSHLVTNPDRNIKFVVNDITIRYYGTW